MKYLESKNITVKIIDIKLKTCPHMLLQRSILGKAIFRVLMTAIVLFMALLSKGQVTANSRMNLNTIDIYNTIFYKNISIDDVNIFYRESGIGNKTTILFLHGFPSSSHMFRHLLINLSDSFHVIAPDYPGFGYSDSPSPDNYNYTFENLSITIQKFIEKLGLENLHLYMQDYGGPVGFRIASRNPQLIKSIIIQNANAYQEGFGKITIPFQSYFTNPTPENEKAIEGFLTLEGTKFQYIDGAKDSTKISPDSYLLDSYFLMRQGNAEIQLKLFRDYITNVQSYEVWHKYFRKFQPSTLIVWGKNDKIFVKEGADAYKRDLPEAEIHLFEGGHFMLEEYSEEVSVLIKKFLKKESNKNLYKENEFKY